MSSCDTGPVRVSSKKHRRTLLWDASQDLWGAAGLQGLASQDGKEVYCFHQDVWAGTTTYIVCLYSVIDIAPRYYLIIAPMPNVSGLRGCTPKTEGRVVWIEVERAKGRAQTTTKNDHGC
jgi:hypothetical protein